MLTKQTIPEKDLRKILANFFDLNDIKKTEPVETSGNIAYRVKTKNKEYFLRLSPDGFRWRSEEEIVAEIELLDYLASNKFPVLPATENGRGKKIVAWNNHFGYLREFIPAKEKMNPTAREIEKLGETLGQLHLLTENFKTKNNREHVFDPKETKKNFIEDKEEILKSDFPEKENFLEKLEKELFSLDFPDDLPQGMIHEDLGKRHVLWRKSEIAAVIDFDRSYFGKLILDLGQAARGWCFSEDWKEWKKENFEALVRGYQKKRRLTGTEKQCLADAIKFGILERGLSFCLRFLTTRDKDDASFAKDCVFRQIDLIELSE